MSTYQHHHTTTRSTRRQDRHGAPVALAVSAAVSSIFAGSAFGKGGNIQVQRVAAGAATIARQGLNTRITAVDRTVIDYARFNLMQDQSVVFALPTAHASILNRINSSTPSTLDGRISSNGIVYFANPAGVVFGPHSVVNAAGLFAAAGTMSNKDFAAGTNHFTDVHGGVVNDGTLRANVVNLIGQRVVNNGVIVGANTVTMVSGNDVLMGDRFGGILVKVDTVSNAAAAAPQPSTSGHTMPLGAGDMYSLAVVNAGQIRGSNVTVQSAGAASVSGKIDASNPQGIGGKVLVTGTNVSVSAATIDASGATGGGSVLIGGDAHGQGSVSHAANTSVSADSTIRADAGTTGAGGKVVVWSDQTTEFHGLISARGGSNSGDGGFVETSGHNLDFRGGLVDTSAPHGAAGTWLQDPDNLLIDTAAALADANALQLGGNVTATTTNGGTISVTGALSAAVPVQGAGHPNLSVTLVSDSDISISATGSIVSTLGPLDVTFTAPKGDVTLQGPVTTMGGSLTSTGLAFTNSGLGAIDAGAGSVTLMHSGPVSLGAAIVHAGSVNLSSLIPSTPPNPDTLAGSRTVSINNSITSSLAGGTVSVQATDGISFGPLVTVTADNQAYQAGTGTGAAAKADLTTNSPAFLPYSATNIQSFVHHQDAGIDGAQVVTSAQFGSHLPVKYTIQSDGGDVKLASYTDVSGSGVKLTVQGTGVTLPSASTAVPFDTLTVNATSATETISLGGDMKTSANSLSLNSVADLTLSSNLTNNSGAIVLSSKSPITPTSTTGHVFLAGNVTASSITVHGSDGIAFAAGSLMTADTQQYQAGTGSGTTAVADLVTHAPTFAPSGSQIVSFTHQQDAGIDGTTVAPAQFTGGLPAAYKIESDGGLIHITSAISDKNTNITLIGHSAATGDSAVKIDATLDVKSLTADGSGNPIQINSSPIVTSAGQTYLSEVTLLSDATFHDTGAQNIAFQKKVDGLFGLTLDTAGQVAFHDAVSVGDLTTVAEPSAAGVFVYAPSPAATSITTTASGTAQGHQTYNTPVTLLAAGTTLMGTQLDAEQTITGGAGDHALTLQFSAASTPIGGDKTVSGQKNVLLNLSDLTVGPTASAATTITSSIATRGSQTYNDPVTLAPASGSAITLSSSGALTPSDITFNNKVNANVVANVAQIVDLVVHTPGTAAFDRSVGGDPNAALASLKVDQGPTSFGGSSPITINTQDSSTAHGAQIYSGDVTLNQNAALSVAAGGSPTAEAVTFSKTVAGGSSLTVNTAGPTEFDGKLDVGRLSVTSSKITLNAGSVTTTVSSSVDGTQTFDGPVTLSQTTQLKSNGGGITFTGTLDGAYTLTSDTTGPTEFDKNIGDTTPLKNLTVNSGPTQVNGTSILTSGAQLYAGDVTLGGGSGPAPGALFDFHSKGSGGNGTIAFQGRVTSAGSPPNYNLKIDTADITSFGGPVNVGSMNVASGATQLSGSPITTIPNPGFTDGSQAYKGAVTLAGNVVLNGTTLNATAGIDGGKKYDLTLIFSDPTIQIGGSTPNALTNIQNLVVGSASSPIHNARTTITSDIKTTGSQTYNDAVTLKPASGALTLSTTAGPNDITFNNTVDGNADLTVDTAGTTGFNAAVGGTARLNSLLVANGPTAIGGTNTLTISTQDAGSLHGAQTFNGAVTLNQTATLAVYPVASPTAGNVTFDGTVAGSGGLTVKTAGKTLFNASVNIDSLTTDNEGTNDQGTFIDDLPSHTAASITTAGGQTYNDPVTLLAVKGSAPSTTFTSTSTDVTQPGDITFGDTLTGASNVTIYTDGNASFLGKVGVTSLTVLPYSSGGTGQGGGPTPSVDINGGSITTGYWQTYAKPVVLSANAVLTSTAASSANHQADITFESTLGGLHDLEVNTIGGAVFQGNVNIGDLLVSNAGGQTVIGKSNQGSISITTAQSTLNVTAGNQTYLNQVTLLAKATTLQGVQLDAENTIQGDSSVPKDLALLFSTDTTHNVAKTRSWAGTPIGGVSGNGQINVLLNIGNLTVGQNPSAPATTTITSSITTLQSQIYNDPVTLQPVVGTGITLMSSQTPSGSGPFNIEFRNTVTGALPAPDAYLITQTAGTTIFGGTVDVGGLYVSKGPAEIDTTSILTHKASLTALNAPNSQVYANGVILFGSNTKDATGNDPVANTSVTLADDKGGGIAFLQALTDHTANLTAPADDKLTISTTGPTTFGGQVNMGGLYVSQPQGSVEVDGGAITTHGVTPDGLTGSQAQVYAGNVSINEAPGTTNGPTSAILSGQSALPTADNGITFQDVGATPGDITFVQTLTSRATDAVKVSTLGQSTFGGAADVGALYVSRGTSLVDGGSMTTHGQKLQDIAPASDTNPLQSQVYAGDVISNGNLTVTTASGSKPLPLALTVTFQDLGTGGGTPTSGGITFVNQLLDRPAYGNVSPNQIDPVTISTKSQTTFGGNVDVGGLYVKSGPTQVDAGSTDGIHITTHGILPENTSGTASEGQSQFYSFDVTVNGHTVVVDGGQPLPTNKPVLFEDQGTLAVNPKFGGITFAGQLLDQPKYEDTQANPVDPITVSTQAQATFGGTVDVGGLYVNQPKGSAEIDGHSVMTHGVHADGVLPQVAQVYAGTVAVYGPRAALLNGNIAPAADRGVTFADDSASPTKGGIAFLQELSDRPNVPSNGSSMPIDGITVSTSAQTTFGGAVNVGGLYVSKGVAEVDGGVVTSNGVTPSGLNSPQAQLFAGNVVLNGHSAILDDGTNIASHTPVTFQDLNGTAPGHGDITFVQQLTDHNADPNNAAADDKVTISTQGQVTVGGQVNVGGLFVSQALGSTEADGGTITTHGFTPDGLDPSQSQLFAGNVVLNGGSVVLKDGTPLPSSVPVTFQDLDAANKVGHGGIAFLQQLTDHNSDPTSPLADDKVTITTNGRSTFGGQVNVGGLYVTQSDGSTEMDGGTVTTHGATPDGLNAPQAQVYAGNVVLNGGGAVLNGGSTMPSHSPVLFQDGSSANPGRGGIAFLKQLTDHTPDPTSTAADDTVTISTQGLATFGGKVNLGGLYVNQSQGTTEVDGGTISTRGFTPDGLNLHQSQVYAGNVSVNEAPGTTNGQVTAITYGGPVLSPTDPVVFQDPSGGNITFIQTLTSRNGDAVTIATKAQTTFGAKVDTGGLFVSLGNAEVDGGAVTTHGVVAPTVLSAQSQVYAKDVAVNFIPGQPGQTSTILKNGSPLPTSDATTFSDLKTGGITFVGSLGSRSIDPVTVATDGSSAFGGPVDVGGLYVSRGPAIVDGGTVTTRGISPAGVVSPNSQVYADNVAVNASLSVTTDGVSLQGTDPVVFQDTKGGGIAFVKELTSLVSDPVTLSTTGQSTFGGQVDVGGLDVNLGTAEVDGGTVDPAHPGTITTHGVVPPGVASPQSQVYAFDVTVNGQSQILAGQGSLPSHDPVHFDDTSNGGITFVQKLTSRTSDPVTVSTTGLSAFGGKVDVGGLSVDQGQAEVDGGAVITHGITPPKIGTPQAQVYAQNVTVNGGLLPATGPQVLFQDQNSGGITFAKQLNSRNIDAITLDTLGLGAFGGAVKVGGLYVKQGPAEVDGPSITTDGVAPAGVASLQSQVYAGDLTVNGTLLPASSSAVLFADVAGGGITATHKLTSRQGDAITFTTAGLSAFGGVVDVGGLEVSKGDAQIDGATVTTHGVGMGGGAAQLYIGNVIANGTLLPDHSPVLLDDTNGGGITFTQKLSSRTGDPVTLTTAGLSTFGGTVDVGGLDVSKGKAEVDGASVTTHGVVPPGIGSSQSQVYANDVQVNGLTLPSHGPTLFDDLTGGGIAFTRRVRSGSGDAVTVATTGLGTFGGTVDVGGLAVTEGNAEIDGGSVTSHGVSPAGSKGAQFYAFDVTLNGSMLPANQPVQFTDTAHGDIYFNHHLTSDRNDDVTLSSSGAISFQGPVLVGTLTAGGGGTTNVDGGTVTTSGFQHYNEAVALGADASLTSTGAGDVVFAHTVSGLFHLGLNTAGQSEFDGQVNIDSLTTDYEGPHDKGTFLNVASGTPSIQTAEAQQYNDDVTLQQNSVVQSAGGNIVFGHTITGPNSLSVNTPGITQFNGSVNVASVSTDYEVNGDKGTFINIPPSTSAAAITTSGAQHFADNVTLQQNGTTDFASTGAGNITFDRIVGQQVGVVSDLRVNTQGVTTFNGPVNVNTLATDAGGATAINNNISTHGDFASGSAALGMEFGDDVAITNTATLTAERSGIQFDRTVQLQGDSVVTMTTSNAPVKFQGDATFSGSSANVTTNGGAIEFSQSAIFSAGHTTLSSGDGDVRFDAAVSDSTGALATINTANGNVTFAGVVNDNGGTATLDIKVGGAGDVTFNAPVGGTNTTASGNRISLTVQDTGGDVLFKAPANVANLSASGKNIVETGVTAVSDIVLQPHANLLLADPAEPKDLRPYTIDGGTLIPDGMLFLQGSLSGNVVELAPAARTIAGAAGTDGTPTVATIVNVNATKGLPGSPLAIDPASARDISISAGRAFLMGPDEKLTVIASPSTPAAPGKPAQPPQFKGVLSVQVSGKGEGIEAESKALPYPLIPDAATLGDLSAAYSITVKAPVIAFWQRAASKVLDSAPAVVPVGSAKAQKPHQTTLAAQFSPDTGRDYFAAQNLTFDTPTFKAEVYSDTGPTTVRPARTNDASFGVFGGVISDPTQLSLIEGFHLHVNPTAVFKNEKFIFSGLPNELTQPEVLDATPSGPSPTEDTSVLAQALPQNAPQPTEEANISKSDLKTLLDMGIFARPLNRQEEMDKALGRILYLDVPLKAVNVQPEDLKFASGKLPFDVTKMIVREYKHAFAPDQNEPDDATVRKGQDETRNELGQALADYQTWLGDDDPDPWQFRAFLNTPENIKRYRYLRQHLDRIRDVHEKLQWMGLTDVQVTNCESRLIGGIVPTTSLDLSPQQVQEAILAHPPSVAGPVILSTRSGSQYTVPAKMRDGKVQIDPSGSNGAN